jgi:RNA polymerase sigma-70 factor (ECF subfamily)
MTPDEREWKRRLRSGEPGDFQAFYAQYGAPIYRFCRRLCGDASDAEDLTQDVFIAAFQGIERFEGRSSIATWLYRIAYYRWKRLNESQRPETVFLDDAMAETIAGPDGCERDLDRLELRRALAILPIHLRAAILLVKVEGLTCREAAEALGVPTGTVKYHVHEAVVRLKTYLSAEAEIPLFKEPECKGIGDEV